MGLTPDGHQVERWFFWPQQPFSQADTGAGSVPTNSTAAEGPAAALAAALAKLVLDLPAFNTREALKKAITESARQVNGEMPGLKFIARY